MVAPAPRITIPDDELAEFCRRWRIVEVALFGSVLREDFGPDSDVDVLVEFAPDARWSLFDMVTLEDELAAMLGRPVDVLERQSVASDPNWIRRRSILSGSRVIYDAR